MDDPVSDYDDVMGAVEDGYIPYDEVNCKHGTFVGTAGGPDYMCGYCEMGVTDEEWEEGRRRAARRDARRLALRPKLDQLIELVNAEAAKKPRDEDELWRLINRMWKLAFWGVRPHYDVLAQIQSVRKAGA
jgi:hypothetical protein